MSMEFEMCSGYTRTIFDRQYTQRERNRSRENLHRGIEKVQAAKIVAKRIRKLLKWEKEFMWSQKLLQLVKIAQC